MAYAIEYKGFDHIWDYSGPWFWILVGIYFSLPIIAYKVLPLLTTPKSNRHGKRRSIALFVLGDLGHSPRMCYHASSFSKLDYDVNLCGYLETEPPLHVIDDMNIDIHEIEVVKNTSGLPYLAFAAKKICIQFKQLFQLLFQFRGIDYIMIQNPPSVPILIIIIVFVTMFSRNTQLIIDWHNLNYSILNLRYKNAKHPIVRLVRFYEQFLGKFASLNITVTKQMKQFLIKEFGFKESKIVTLYDRPGYQFKPLQLLSLTKSEFLQTHDIFKEIENIDNYKILVSSTSFTPDEDFTPLLNALKNYEETENVPPVILIVTGKGPLKSQFLQTVKDLAFSSKVIIKTAWLAAEEYPIILALADLGVSLHTSSSGIDLPMKIVDFFGCGIPVISLSFPAIYELVKQDVNGLIADGSKDPQDEIYRLLIQAMSDTEVLDRIKQGAMKESDLRWDQNWLRVLKKSFEYNQRN